VVDQISCHNVPATTTAIISPNPTKFYAYMQAIALNSRFVYINWLEFMLKNGLA
jgi:hypothetical protein